MNRSPPDIGSPHLVWGAVAAVALSFVAEAAAVRASRDQ